MKEQSDTPETDAAEREDAGPITHAIRGWNYARKHERERDEARAEVERMRGALRGLHDDIVEYQRINHLGGYDNHWMLAAREALAATEAKP